MTTFEQAKQLFTQQLANPEHVFSETLGFIDQWFEFEASAFANGPVSNSIEQNQGSCKVLALAEVLDLSDEQTLLCFGEHYRDVLATPTTDNHHNLRRLLRDGCTEIQFDRFPLTVKSTTA